MPLNERDIERLSAYLDNALDDDDRAQVEARLASDPEFRRELERLRATVALIRELPPLAAPRDLRLTRKMVEPPRVLMFPATPIFSGVSAAAAIVLFLAGIVMLSTARPDSAPPQIAFMPTQTLMTAIARSAVQSTPTVAAELFMQEAEEEDGETMDAFEAPELAATMLPATPALDTAEAGEAAEDTGLADEAAAAAAGAVAADDAAESAPEIARSAIITTTPDDALRFIPEEPGVAELMMQPSQTPSLMPTREPTETTAPTPAPTVTSVPTPEPLETEPDQAADGALTGALLIGIAALLLILSGTAAVRGRGR